MRSPLWGAQYMPKGLKDVSACSFGAYLLRSPSVRLCVPLRSCPEGATRSERERQYIDVAPLLSALWAYIVLLPLWGNPRYRPFSRPFSLFKSKTPLWPLCCCPFGAILAALAQRATIGFANKPSAPLG